MLKIRRSWLKEANWSNSLWGDQHRILQVIINLVSNSLKFAPDGGKVEVRIKCLGEAETASDKDRNSMGSGSKRSSQRNSRPRHGSGHGSGSNTSQISRNPNSAGSPAGTALLINPMDLRATPRVQVRERSPTPPPSHAKTFIFQFEVEDTGPGIPLHLQERVFEPFVQGDLGLSKKFGGTGLGLSICSQLAGLMGGDISLVSSQEPPSGTLFTVKIPLKFAKSRAPSTSSSDVYGSRPVSVSNGVQPEGNPVATASSESRQSSDFEKDTQPRLIGLSQPFFSSVSAPSPKSKDAKEPLAVLGKAIGKSAGKSAGNSAVKSTLKLRVLVAEVSVPTSAEFSPLYSLEPSQTHSTSKFTHIEKGDTDSNQDNLVNQEIVIRMLKLEDIYDVEVVIAKDGKEAYDIVKESMDKGQYFNLIFMDIQVSTLNSA